MRIFSDEELKNIRIQDNGEPLVNLSEACPTVFVNINPRSRRAQNLSPGECYLRASVAAMLCAVQEKLDNSNQLMIWEGFRSQKWQKAIWDECYANLQKQHPGWSTRRLSGATDDFAAPISNPDVVPPHTTGGAIDLTIVDQHQRQLDMGTKIGELLSQSHTEAKEISTEGIKNRGLLVRAMSAAGFVNYPLEWWHWSYGDRYWAAALGKNCAIYGRLVK